METKLGCEMTEYVTATRRRARSFRKTAQLTRELNYEEGKGGTVQSTGECEINTVSAQGQFPRSLGHITMTHICYARAVTSISGITSGRIGQSILNGLHMLKRVSRTFGRHIKILFK